MLTKAKATVIPDATLLTLPEAAALLRLQPSTLRAWVLKRRIVFIKLGRLVRFRRADLEAMLDDSVVPVELA
jgi:excisionase family DNA binding protein